MTSYAKNSTLALPMLADLNREMTERNALLLLRTLNTSDLAWMYMLLAAPTIRDICEMCTALLDAPRDGYPERNAAPWALDMTPNEYAEAKGYIAEMLDHVARVEALK